MTGSYHVFFFLILTMLPVKEASAEEGGAEEAVSSPAREQAEQHFERGMVHVRHEQWAEALDEFQRALELYSTQTTMYNVGLCLRLMGREVEAARVFEEHLARYGSAVDEARRQEVEQQLQELNSRVARIRLDVTGPERAVVLVDDEEMGRTPLQRHLIVGPGQHTVTVRADGFHEVSRQVSLIGGQEMALPLSMELIREPGQLRVQVAVPGARISIDNQEVGSSPLVESVETSAGEHVVEASRPGYLSSRVTVEVPEGDETEVELTLRPMSPIPIELQGTLDVHVDRPDADVMLDGELLARGPVVVGPHHLEVRAEGAEPWTREIEVARGVTNRVDVELGGGPEIPADGGRSLRIAGWALAGVALAALGAGFGLYGAAGGMQDTWSTEDARLTAAFSSTEEPANEEQLWNDVAENDELAGNISTLDAVGWTLVGLGLASTAAAVALVVIGYRQRSDGPRVSLIPGPGSLALSTSW